MKLQEPELNSTKIEAAWRGPAMDAARRRTSGNPALVRGARYDNNAAGLQSRLQEPARDTGGDWPLVSVITVVLNRETTLPDAMRSVFDQNYQGEIEYILIDGGSTDGTIEVIRKYETRLAAWISEKDAGISDAFNRGLALANGEIIGILNSDDWYETNTVERAVRAFREQPGAGVACGRLQYWKAGKADAIFPSLPDQLGIDMTVNHPTMFVHRRLYERAGLFKLDYRYAMDYELALRFQAMGARFASVEGVLANMRYDGAADRNWFRSLREMRRAQREIYPGRFAFAYALKFARSVTGRLLAALGLGALNRLYRSRVSRFRRSYENAG
ncbi:MAG: glycosyltransferase family 2 protein [Leptospirales bacterium]|jgi:glycosyltransferase involved in cell wall biosynthesis